MTKLKLFAGVGCVLAMACSSPVPSEDAGAGGGSGGGGEGGGSAGGGAGGGDPVDSGTDDAGTTDAGEQDAGVVDAGCVGTAAAQLGFGTPPYATDAKKCTGPLKVQLQTACGVPVNAGADLAVTFSASSATTEFFGDSQCIGKPSVFNIPSGANFLDVFFRDTAHGMSTITATAAGVDGGSQTQTFACATGEKICNTSCIAIAACCTTADCVSPKICNAMNQCKIPPCQPGFVSGCTPSNFVPYDGGIITVGSPFNPKCVEARSTANVRYQGSLHTVEQYCGPRELNINKIGSTSTITGQGGFETYGLRCSNHPMSAFELGALKHN